MRKQIASWVLSARRSALLSQEAMGNALGVSKANISAWENQRHEPSLTQLIRIADLCSYPISKLLKNNEGRSREFEELLPEEVRLLRFYREATPDVKNILERMVSE